MRVRIRKSAEFDTWYVEYKKWFHLTWVYLSSHNGASARDRATEVARAFINPQIMEVTKEQP